MARSFIEDLEWDDATEDHMAEHLDPGVIDAMIRAQNWVQVRIKKRHPTHRIRLIGREPSGSMLTAFLEPTQRSGVWRPVTGCWSTEAKATLNHQQKARKKRNA